MTKEEREQFAKDNIKLIDYFMDMYHIKYKDDLRDLFYIAYTKAIDVFDPEKGAFSTIAMEYMKREYLKYLYVTNLPMRNSKDFTFVYLDSTVSDESDSSLVGELIADPTVDVEGDAIHNVYVEDTFANIVDVVNNATINGKAFITKRQKTVFQLRFIDGYNQVETAKIMGVTHQLISTLEQNMIRRLSWWFKKHENRTRLHTERENDNVEIVDLFGLTDKNSKEPKQEENNHDKEVIDLFGLLEEDNGSNNTLD